MNGVSEYIVNPRRAPRAPARCAAQVTAADGTWSAQTEDIGPTGCQLIAPGPVARGQRLSITFTNPKVAGTLQVEGKAAWCSPRSPWRVGVAFADATRPAAERWFALLVAAHPGVGAFRRVPERLPVDAMLFLSPPPTFLVDFSDDEVAVLCHVASGTTLASLRERLAGTWSASQRATFSLLSRGMVTVSRSASAHPAAWKKVMAELGAEFVSAAPRAARPAPFTEAVALGDEALPEVEADFELDPAGAAPPQPSTQPPPLPPDRLAGRRPDPLPGGPGVLRPRPDGAGRRPEQQRPGPPPARPAAGPRGRGDRRRDRPRHGEALTGLPAGPKLWTGLVK
jgi:hypothetical protein